MERDQDDYEKLFASKGAYRFEFYDYTLHKTGDLFYAVGRERGEMVMRVRVVTLNVWNTGATFADWTSSTRNFDVSRRTSWPCRK